MPRGRPKKKPNVDIKAEIAEMVSQACQLLIEPFDDRTHRPDNLPSMNSVAEEMGVTIIKLKRLLITGDFYSSATSRAVQKRIERGMSMDQICSELNIRPSSFYANIPYSKGAYNLNEPSLCADQNVMYRKRKAAIKELQATIATGTSEEQRLSLWKTICLFQDYLFTTTGRGKEKKGAIKFKYTVSAPGSAGGRHYDGPAVDGFGNEMWIRTGGEQKKKSISRSTVEHAFGTSEYGLSKKAGEELFFNYAVETGAKVLVYRFPNLVGKWVRPNYNSAVGTFCNNIANDLPITVNDPSVELELLFIDDLIDEMYNALEGKEHHCYYPPAGTVLDGVEYDGVTAKWSDDGRYCGAPVTHKATLGYIVECLEKFHDQPLTLMMPSIPKGSFEKKLYSMYLSYLPAEKVAFDFDMKCDDRGSFTELLKTVDHGQFSVNISKADITKGQHWHNSKWEFFIVVSGHGLIQERKLGIDFETGIPYEPIEFEVFGGDYAGRTVICIDGTERKANIQAAHMLPGYTHKLINLSETENLVTLMWANEIFDPEKPDTFYEPV